jgi:hypothetical protein
MQLAYVMGAALTASAVALAGPAGATEIDLTGLDVLETHTADFGGTILSWHASGAIDNGIGSNDPFLELVQQGGAGPEQGYNTDATIQFSTTQSAEALLLSDVPLVTIGGVNYLEFALGVNATGGDKIHSLDEFQIFQSENNAEDNYVDTGPTLNGLPLVFDWFGNNDSDTYAVLRDDVSGQSNIDYLFYVNASAIDTSKDYLYLYAELGFTDVCLPSEEDCDADDGEDRWVVDRSNPPFGFCSDVTGLDCTIVPEPGTLLLLGAGLAWLGGFARRRRA